MQTFLPLADYAGSASVLDYRRLGKQRSETLILMQVLLGERVVSRKFDHWRIDRRGRTVAVEEELPRDQWYLEPVTTRGWISHAVTRMWRGYEASLLEYQRAICVEWARRQHKDTCLSKTLFLFHHARADKGQDQPYWLGDERLHASHRSVLLFKNPEYYERFNWTEAPGQDYYWPKGTKCEPARRDQEDRQLSAR